ncbi:hypothetical protein BGZ60DRAFT_185598 [Tricladium varicosporioides]|nr:hypothetical protein BGZ60DRAFT_185598 [Hymenoscyphus varicosporioides]
MTRLIANYEEQRDSLAVDFRMLIFLALSPPRTPYQNIPPYHHLHPRSLLHIKRISQTNHQPHFVGHHSVSPLSAMKTLSSFHRPPHLTITNLETSLMSSAHAIFHLNNDDLSLLSFPLLPTKQTPSRIPHSKLSTPSYHSQPHLTCHLLRLHLDNAIVFRPHF